MELNKTQKDALSACKTVKEAYAVLSGFDENITESDAEKIFASLNTERINDDRLDGASGGFYKVPLVNNITVNK